jgi:hypothetical protein
MGGSQSQGSQCRVATGLEAVLSKSTAVPVVRYLFLKSAVPIPVPIKVPRCYRGTGTVETPYD